ncbi:MAG: hydrogenase small subunit [Acidobacteriota bacterium]
MKVSRRDFMKYCAGSAAALGLDMTALGGLEKALSASNGPPIIWLAGANCTGCTVSLANRFSSTAPAKDLGDLLINTINLVYHPNLMGAAGDLAVQTLRKAEAGKFILAVEGGIPTAFGGRTCFVFSEGGRDYTALEVVKELAARASNILSIGTCASFGGIPAGNPNPTKIQSVSAATGKQTINIPGCPTHPDWIVGTIATLLGGTVPALDSSRRPTAYFGSTVHSRCPRQNATWATTLGQDGLCLRDKGCKGPNTRSDCPSRMWNSKTNWCIGANAICLGCTQNGFPDSFSPFFSSAGATPGSDHPRTTQPCSTCHPGGNFDDD